MGPISLARWDSGCVRWRSRLVRTALASNGVPSAKVIPVRTGMVTVSPSDEIAGSSVASCGTISPPAFRS